MRCSGPWRWSGYAPSWSTIALAVPHTKCRRRSYMLAPRATPGYCSHCGRWLGLPNDECLQSGIACLDMEEVRWQRWVSAEVGKLLAASPNLGLAQGRKNFSEAVEMYLLEMAGGNVSAIARKFRVDRKTIRSWKNGTQIPQLASLLQICYLCDISPLSLFTDGMCKIREETGSGALSVMRRNRWILKSTSHQ